MSKDAIKIGACRILDDSISDAGYQIPDVGYGR